MGYIILESSSARSLENKVNEKISEGYVPVNALSVASSSAIKKITPFIGDEYNRVETTNTYAQGMIKN